jgi:hypothetical protein
VVTQSRCFALIKCVQKGSDGEDLSQDRKKGAPENRRERQTLSLRQVSQEKSETCQDGCALVLPKLPESRRCTIGFNIGVTAVSRRFHVLREVQRGWV